jgi:hypothetical protein
MSETEWGPSKQKQVLEVLKELESEGIVDLEEDFSEVMSDEEFNKLCKDVRNANYNWDKPEVFRMHVLKKKISCRQISRAFCLLDITGSDQIKVIKNCLGHISDPENYRQIYLKLNNLYNDDRNRLFNAFYDKEDLKTFEVQRLTNKLFTNPVDKLDDMLVVIGRVSVLGVVSAMLVMILMIFLATL